MKKVQLEILFQGQSAQWYYIEFATTILSNNFVI
jgi:hypothetical protein